jgi:hypothetical protein
MNDQKRRIMKKILERAFGFTVDLTTAERVLEMISGTRCIDCGELVQRIEDNQKAKTKQAIP